MSTQIVPFQSEHVPEAAKLLADRHRRDSEAVAELPRRFEEQPVAEHAIEAALTRDHALGFAALDDGRLVAYLIGDMVVDSAWGRSGWVRLPGCAYDLNVSVEIVGDLYATLGEHWVDHGVFSHIALMPISDPDLLHAWFSLGFGIEQIHGLLDLTTIGPNETPFHDGIEIRQASPGDGNHLAALSDVIWHTQVQAPVWGAMMPEAANEIADGWAGLVDEEDVTAWLAVSGETPVGAQVYWPALTSDENMLIDEQCIHLGVAGTRESARGQGIGTAMTERGLAHAADAGYRTCETDWRSTNLFSSRFWPRRGFRPAAYRLARRIDTRISWAKG